MRFSLSSSPVFSRSDLATDSERFYNSVLLLFDDAEEQDEVDELLVWWNRYESMSFQLSDTLLYHAILSVRSFLPIPLGAAHFP